MIKQEIRKPKVQKRHRSIRINISGDSEYPRLAVYRSTKHIYAQVIDDVTKTTLASSSNLELKIANGGNIEAAKAVGKDVAEKCKKLKIKKVVFDRGGYQYHGRVEALADAAREAGLEF